MFRRGEEIRRRVMEIVEKFRAKGAISARSKCYSFSQNAQKKLAAAKTDL
jgi:hypothetical protein